MVLNPKLKFLSVLLLLWAFLLYSNWLIIKKQHISTWEFGNDRVSLYGRSLEGLREKLPSGGVRIGYMTDVPIIFDRSDLVRFKKGEPGSSERNYYEKLLKARRDYVIFQYFLSPLLIYPNSKEPFVILNFKDSETDYRDFLPGNYALLQDFGDGLMLFEDKSR